MKLHKALKVKNRLVGEVTRLKNILARENSYRSDNISTTNHSQVESELNLATEKLIELKAKLGAATVPIIDKLVRLEELKGSINFLNSLHTREGKEIVAINDSRVEEYTWFSYINKEKVDSRILSLQLSINSLQDEIDDFNAKTDIDFN